MVEESIVKAVKEAIEKSKKRNFEETVEVAFNLKDVDMSNPKNRIDIEVPLPKGRGKPVRIGLFGTGELAVKAKGVADTILGPEDLEKLAEDKKSARKLANTHAFFLAEAPLMPVIGKRLGAVLGPRGKMPKPIPPMADPKPIISNLRNTVKIRSKDKLTFHAPVGTKSMPPEDIAENIETVINRIASVLERGRGNIKTVYVKTTMGPAVRVM